MLLPDVAPEMLEILLRIQEVPIRVSTRIPAILTVRVIFHGASSQTVRTNTSHLLPVFILPFNSIQTMQLSDFVK